jgi:dihydrofolate reductase
MILSLIVARASNGVIGADGGLPWHISADLKHFKALTVGKPIIMGRRTYTSIGKPLPGRHNIVLTRNPDWRAAGVTVVPNLAEAIAAAGLDPRARADEIMVIGGVAVFEEALPSARRVHLTEVHAAPAGDTVLPAFDPAIWAETTREDHDAAGDTPGYSFVTLERRT